MKPLILLVLFASAVLAINQDNQQPEAPPDSLCGKVEDIKCIQGGVLNKWVKSVVLPAYPQNAQSEGTVTVQLLYNEDGEVIFASPVSGPEELWAASVKATVNTRFDRIKLSGRPVKIKGVLNVDFKNGKIDVPIPANTAPVNRPRP